MSDQIDVNQLSNALQQKVDLPSGKSQADIDYVVEWKAPTSSDPTWYRLYKSGWVEQGGIYTNANTTQPTQYKHTITFSKPFKDTTYTVTALGWSSDDTNYYQDGVFESSTTPRTASTFTVDHENFVTKFCLKAEGMSTQS